MQTQRNYSGREVRFGERFVDIYTNRAEEQITVDYGRLDETEPVTESSFVSNRTSIRTGAEPKTDAADRLEAPRFGGHRPPLQETDSAARLEALSGFKRRSGVVAAFYERRPSSGAAAPRRS
ncbi:MAG: hypothetical protein H0T95_13775 [Chthoniobacterales bacterium]|nr:hypothetical protein [Chthoniobacterales bacterium]